MPRRWANPFPIIFKTEGAKCAFCPGAENFFQKGVDKYEFMVYNEFIK